MAIPTNLNECFEWIDNLNMKDLDNFIKLSEKEAITKTHFGFGMWLRNNLELWQHNQFTNWFNNKGIYHADDMSGIIIKSYHRYKNGKKIKLQKQIEHYQKYWKKQGVDFKEELRKERKQKLNKLDTLDE